MKIRNLNATSQPGDIDIETAPAAEHPQAPPPVNITNVMPDRSADPGLVDRQALEIALLRTRVQHLELVVETARSLLNANQDRLLRRLHEVPRELASLTSQLQRVDPKASW